MKNKILTTVMTLLFLAPVYIYAQEVKSMQDLFSALKAHPQTIGDSLAVESAITGKRKVLSSLFPTVTAFGTYNNYSTPTALLPVTPNELVPMVQDQTIPQPFSENIYRAGLSISMPVFIKSIYTTAKKAEYMHKSAQAKQQLNLLQNEAIIVSSNANLQYLDALTLALESKKQSLQKTSEIIAMKVKNGRASGSNLLIIDDAINEVETTKNEIAINREQAIAAIETLTSIRIEKPIRMFEKGTINNDSIKSLEPLQQKMVADELGFRAEKEKLLPSVLLRENYNHSFANAYNNNIAIDNNYNAIGLVISIPIFNKSQYTQIKKSKIEYYSTQNEFDKLKLTLISQANQLENSLRLLYKSEELYQQSIQNKEEILKIAKVSYQSSRISIEDYLKYEDDLVLEKAKLYKTQAEKWQTLMKLAVIYGNNIENLVK